MKGGVNYSFSVNYKEPLIISSISLFVYFIFSLVLNISIDDNVLFSTPDSQTYLDVTKWIFSDDSNSSFLIRPILYPLIIGVFYYPFGAIGLWFIQFIMWLITANMIYFTTLSITKNKNYSITAWLFFILNVSLIAMTFHALTETSTCFLLVLFAFFVNKLYQKGKLYSSSYLIIGILSLLTILKPAFYYLFIISVIVVVFSLFLVPSLGKFKRSLLIFISITPVLIQSLIIYNYTNEFKISFIGERTFKDYFLSEIYAEKNKLEVEDARPLVYKLNSGERTNIIIDNKYTSICLYLKNLKDNIISPSTYTFYAIKKPSKFIFQYAEWFNRFYLIIHMLFLIFFIINLYSMVFKFEFNNSILILILGITFYYYMLLTGISFWQGDRLVLPTIALWPIFYSISINEIRNRRSLLVISNKKMNE
jgi:hypothetical protein